MSTADDAASEQEPERNLAAELDEVRKTIEANQRAADRLWVPSSVIERLLWQVCGAWETVIEQVRFFHYVLHENPPIEPPFPHPDGENVARDMRRIAKKTNLRLPGNTIWTEECKRAKAMRDNLGHMLHFKSIDGTTPDQSVTLLRVPYREPDEMSTSNGWARHNRVTVTITEQEAREVLAGLSYVNDCIFALRKFGIEFATWPDGRSTDSVLGLVQWWLDDWGPTPGEDGWTAPTMRQLRIRSKAEFDASLPPHMRPEF
ncbi:hypothetical protein IU450_08245 [Nocardia abscessus]|uniref:hypothetical protein n=1 Tax=Nocardia abscessus TaxID=120957 RepID=UPI001894BA16|nr:hypothetical protein [Nocardia abscessus]MBF6335874.1 hypothetical protein [Nocardia abscessus]